MVSCQRAGAAADWAAAQLVAQSADAEAHSAGAAAAAAAASEAKEASIRSQLSLRASHHVADVVCRDCVLLVVVAR